MVADITRPATAGIMSAAADRHIGVAATETTGPAINTAHIDSECQFIFLPVRADFEAGRLWPVPASTFVIAMCNISAREMPGCVARCDRDRVSLRLHGEVEAL
jgi:hypothetical protein